MRICDIAGEALVVRIWRLVGDWTIGSEVDNASLSRQKLTDCLGTILNVRHTTPDVECSTMMNRILLIKNKNFYIKGATVC